MLGALFFPFLLALVVTMLLIPPLMKTAAWAGFLDEPDRQRKVHSRAIPCVGGLALVSGVFLSVFFWVPMSRELTALLLGIGILLVFGAWDDRNGLNYRLKFFSQIVSALIVVIYGGILIQRLPIFDTFHLPFWFSALVTVFAIVGVTNAINLADGLDGLSGGKMLLIFTCMALMVVQVGKLELALLNMIFVGAILGFLRFNTHPAQVFMGDAGSQVLGFSSIVLVLMLTQSSDASFSPALPLLLFALPIFDTLSVMVQRTIQGRPLFAADQNHVHHRLLVLGFSHYQAVFLVYLTQSILITSAYFLRFDNDLLIVSVFIIFSLGLAVLIYVSHNKKRGLGENDGCLVINERLDSSDHVVRVVVNLVSFLLGAMLILSALLPKNISADIWFPSGVLLVSSGSLLLFKLGNKVLWLRVTAYLASAFSIYLFEMDCGELSDIMPFVNSGFVLLAILILVGVAVPDQRFFQITPLDFLIIFLCLIVPGIGYLIDASLPVAVLSARLVVMMYACEFVFAVKQEWSREVAFGVFGMLIILTFRGYL